MTRWNCCPRSMSRTGGGAARPGRGRQERSTAIPWRPRWPGSGPVRVDPPGRPRRRVRPRLQPRTAGRGRRQLDIAVEMSGGIRDDDSLAAALATGCARVNLGTAALENPTGCVGDRPVRRAVAVGLDVRGTTLAARGWTRRAATCRNAGPPGRRRLRPYVVTDVLKDGTLTGPNLDLLREVCARTDRPVVASGGVSASMTCARSPRWSRSASRARSSARPCTRARSPSSRRWPRWRRPDVRVAVRVIPCLDVDAGRVVKGVNFVACAMPATRWSWPRSTTPRAPTS